MSTSDSHTSLCFPEWGGREFTSIKRIDVAKLLDTVEDEAWLASGLPIMFSA